MKGRTPRVVFVFFVVSFIVSNDIQNIEAIFKVEEVACEECIKQDQNSQKTNFEAVSANRHVEWVDDESNVAKVMLDIETVMKPKGADIVLILDTSSSMVFGNTRGHSPCLNDKHHHIVELDRTVKLNLNIDKNKYPNARRTKQQDVKLSLRLKIHRDEQGKQTIVNYTMKGFPEVRDDGLPIADCKPLTALHNESGFNPQQVGFVGDYDAHIWNEWTDESVSRLLTEENGFGNMAYTIEKETQYVPRDFNIINNSIKGSDIYSSDKGCISRLDVAKKASLKLVDEVYKPVVHTDKNDIVNLEKSHNRMNLITFDEQAKKHNDNHFLDVQQEDNLKHTIRNLTTNQNLSTIYNNALLSAKDAIEARSTEYEKRASYVVFISDGKPIRQTHSSDDIEHAVKDLASSADHVYSVGINIEAKNTQEYIQTISTAPSHYHNISDSSNDLNSIFTSIASHSQMHVSNLEIRELLDEKFEVVEDIKNYPTSLFVDDQKKIPSITFNKEGNTLTWKIEETSKRMKLIYFIRRIDGENTPTLPIFDKTSIAYYNNQNEYNQQIYPTLKINKNK